MNSIFCKACKITFENDDAFINHLCWITTGEYFEEYRYLERNRLPNDFECQVSCADAFTGRHIDTIFETRNNLLTSGQDKSLNELFQEISETPSDCIADYSIDNALCNNHFDASGIERFLDSNFQEHAEFGECSRSEQSISKSEHSLPSVTFSFAPDKNFYNFPPYPIYSIQSRLEDTIDSSDSLNINNLRDLTPEDLRCYICGKRFKIKRYISAHLRKVHKLGKSFKCKKCPQSFWLKICLENHMLGHDKTCRICGFVFTKRSSLLKHLRTRHNLINE
ncbi:hypothetical protein NPIL_438061 [Nephila pilipes]|uniref:C2H2-type domain-containing protein n=1 Tax=Nephila pilipes TaxID=299642 RepID=A0A8X6QS21_NEPPI|nr:hypothetical protein NPIL_438061 [Nephila pilipes]